MRSRAPSFKWEYPLLSLRSSSFLRLLPHLLVTSIFPFIFPSITCFRRQFLRKIWPIQLAFRFLISCRIFLCSLTLSNTSSFLTWSVQLIFSILLQHQQIGLKFEEETSKMLHLEHGFIWYWNLDASGSRSEIPGKTVMYDSEMQLFSSCHILSLAKHDGFQRSKSYRCGEWLLLRYQT